MTRVEREEVDVGQINSHIASSALFADKEAVRWRREKKRLKKEKGEGYRGREIERREEDPSGRTKIDGARDIDSYTHYIYVHIKCTF